jgi:hypothetical protein
MPPAPAPPARPRPGCCRCRSTLVHILAVTARVRPRCRHAVVCRGRLRWRPLDCHAVAAAVVVGSKAEAYGRGVQRKAARAASTTRAMARTRPYFAAMMPQRLSGWIFVQCKTCVDSGTWYLSGSFKECLYARRACSRPRRSPHGRCQSALRFIRKSCEPADALDHVVLMLAGAGSASHVEVGGVAGYLQSEATKCQPSTWCGDSAGRNGGDHMPEDPPPPFPPGTQ